MAFPRSINLLEPLSRSQEPRPRFINLLEQLHGSQTPTDRMAFQRSILQEPLSRSQEPRPRFINLLEQLHGSQTPTDRMAFSRSILQEPLSRSQEPRPRFINLLEQLHGSQTPTDQHVYTMYHGTTVASARLIIVNGFRQSTKGMLGPGVYVSRDQDKAKRYPLNTANSDRVILELRVHVGRVKRIDQDDHPLQYSWNSHGYNTAWVPPDCGMKCVPNGLTEDCVFNPRRVEVTGIAQAPNTALKKELETLIANNPRRPWRAQRR